MHDLTRTFALYVMAWLVWAVPESLAAPAGDNILISEIGYDTVGSEPGTEWFELYNPTPAPIDISGWTVTDGEGTFTFPAATVIASGAYFIAAHTAAAFNGLYPGVTVNLAYGAIDVGSVFLANGGDSLSLADAGAVEVDFVSWEGNTAGWTIEANAGESIARASSVDTDLETDWLGNQVPSPGTGSLTVFNQAANPIPAVNHWALALLATLLAWLAHRSLAPGSRLARPLRR